MSANYSTATRTRTYEYRPTVIEDKLLLSRLATQLALVKKDPLGFLKQTARDLFSTRHAILVVAVIAGAVLLASLPATITPTSAQHNANDAGPIEDMVLLDLKNEPGSVGFNKGTGGGSGSAPKRPQGGGGGGNHNPIPAQTGKLPPPSLIPAAIPIAPPIHPPALPVAGIDLDPALWKDLKAPVYGDPRSTQPFPRRAQAMVRESDQVTARESAPVMDPALVRDATETWVMDPNSLVVVDPAVEIRTNAPSADPKWISERVFCLNQNRNTPKRRAAIRSAVPSCCVPSFQVPERWSKSER